VKIIRSLHSPRCLVAGQSFSHPGSCQTLQKQPITLWISSVSLKNILFHIICSINLRKYVQSFQILMQRTCIQIVQSWPTSLLNWSGWIPDSSLGQSECGSVTESGYPDKVFVPFLRPSKHILWQYLEVCHILSNLEFTVPAFHPT